MVAITAGGLLLSWSGQPEWGVPWGPLAVVGAGLAWAIANNLTRHVSAGDPLQIAGTKGVAAGAINLTIALMAFVGLCLLVGFRSSPLPKEDIMFVIAFPYFVLWVYGIIDAWSGAKGQ